MIISYLPSSTMYRIDGIVFSSLLSLTRFQANCGEGIWNQVAKLDMTNVLQNCPSSGWLEVNREGIRGCQKLSHNIMHE